MQTQTTINGRLYDLHFGGDDTNPLTEGTVATYNRIILTGTRGARYLSAEYHDSGLVEFYKDGNGSFPTLAFGSEFFVLDENASLRYATYSEVKEGLQSRTTKTV